LSQASKGAEVRVTVQIPYSKCGVSFVAALFSNTTLKATCIFERE
jgi:hypothetical protein